MLPRLIPILVVLAIRCGLPAQAQNREGMSDVLILVQPLGSQSLIAVTFAKPTSHERAHALLADLAKRGGWKLGIVEIRDETVPADFRDPSKTAKQTGASSTIAGSPLKKDGGFRLQPFVEAFADYSKLEVLFIENADPSFAGLSSFQSGAVTVDLIKPGAPYRYMIRIDKTAGPIPTLPMIQPAAPPQQSAAPRTVPEASRSGSMAFVLLVSAASGLAVFFGLLLVTHLRSRRSVQRHFRRPSRP